MITVSEDRIGCNLKDTPKNKRTIEAIHVLIARVLDIKNEIDDLDDKLESE